MVDFTTKAIELSNEATSLDREQKYEDAYRAYLNALRHFEAAIKYEKSEVSKKMLHDAMVRYLTRAEAIKDMLKKEQKKPVKEGAGRSADDDDDAEKTKFRKNLESSIVSSTPNVKWADVAGLEAAKKALKEAVILPIQFPGLYTGARRPWKGVLLYGPPGTGKSHLAKAVATEAKAVFYSVSTPDIVSKWMGESEKLVRSLFEMARENKPSVVFIDEIDSLVTSRSDNESESSRRIKTEFLVQMDGVGNDMAGVLLLGATNLPWNIDSAMRRRFERRVFIPLPEAAARTEMFRLFLKDTPSDIQRADLMEMGKQTEGFSGSDIANIVRDAIMEPVRRCQEATHFKCVAGTDSQGVMRDDWLIPCSMSDSGAVEMDLMQVPPDRLMAPPVTVRDFQRVIKHSRSSVGKDDLKKYEDWTAEFGQDGA